MLSKLQESWKRWCASRREYQLERALYKAGGGKDARHGGFDGNKNVYDDGHGMPPVPPVDAGPGT
jgi:hypothetical protein